MLSLLLAISLSAYGTVIEELENYQVVRHPTHLAPNLVPDDHCIHKNYREFRDGHAQAHPVVRHSSVWKNANGSVFTHFDGQGWHGLIRDSPDSQPKHVFPFDLTDRGRHIVYDIADLPPTYHRAMKFGDASKHYRHPQLMSTAPAAASTPPPPVGGKAHYTGSTPHIEVLIFNDHSMYQTYGAHTEQQSAHLFALMSTRFSDSAALSINPVVVLRGQVTATTGSFGPEVTTDSSDMLDRFAEWIEDPANNGGVAFDAAIYMTALTLDDSILGVAYVGAPCVTHYRSALVSTATGTDDFDAVVMAHELGHLVFGYCHDPNAVRGPHCADLSSIPSPATTCANRVMSATSTPGAETPTDFSECSDADGLNFEAYVSSMRGPDFLAECWAEPEAGLDTWHNVSECGNGLVEGPEECDSDTDCCESCMLVEGAQCDSTMPCCTDECTFAPVNQSCVSGAACDQTLQCTGSSAYCAADNTARVCKSASTGLSDAAVLGISAGVGALVGLLFVCVYRARSIHTQYRTVKHTKA